MSSQNSRIAKNTLYLYVRTLLIMAVSLYTSRVVLQALGFEDFGIYYTVAGAVAMFGMLTNALSTSISRFITFELGKANDGRLAQVFSSSLRILLIVSLCVVLLGETVGLWALNHWIHIPPERLAAAGWVWQSTLFVFVLGLLSVPYNATIIAHEHMNAFAAISVLEVMLKLASALLLQLVLMDKLTVHGMTPLRACEAVDAMPEILHRTFFIKGDLRREGETRLEHIPPHRAAGEVVVVRFFRIICWKSGHDPLKCFRGVPLLLRRCEDEERFRAGEGRIVLAP